MTQILFVLYYILLWFALTAQLNNQFLLEASFVIACVCVSCFKELFQWLFFELAHSLRII